MKKWYYFEFLTPETMKLLESIKKMIKKNKKTKKLVKLCLL